MSMLVFEPAEPAGLKALSDIEAYAPQHQLSPLDSKSTQRLHQEVDQARRKMLDSFKRTGDGERDMFAAFEGLARKALWLYVRAYENSETVAQTLRLLIPHAIADHEWRWAGRYLPLDEKTRTKFLSEYRDERSRNPLRPTRQMIFSRIQDAVTHEREGFLVFGPNYPEQLAELEADVEELLSSALDRIGRNEDPPTVAGECVVAVVTLYRSKLRPSPQYTDAVTIAREFFRERGQATLDKIRAQLENVGIEVDLSRAELRLRAAVTQSVEEAKQKQQGKPVRSSSDRRMQGGQPSGGIAEGRSMRRIEEILADWPDIWLSPVIRVRIMALIDKARERLRELGYEWGDSWRPVEEDDVNRKTARETAKPDSFRADRRLYLTADKQRVVEEGSLEAAFLLAAKGHEIPIEDAKRLGLVKESPQEKGETIVRELVDKLWPLIRDHAGPDKLRSALRMLGEPFSHRPLDEFSEEAYERIREHEQRAFEGHETSTDESPLDAESESDGDPIPITPQPRSEVVEGSGPVTGPTGEPAPGRSRGRPTKFSIETKRQALAAKKEGKTNRECAQILYGIKYPTQQHAKNVTSILRYFQKTHPGEG